MQEFVEPGFDAAEIVAGREGKLFDALAEGDEGDGLFLVGFARAVFEQRAGVARDTKGLGLVEMAEGVRMMANLEGAKEEQLRDGMPLRVGFKELPSGAVMPYFSLAG